MRVLDSAADLYEQFEPFAGGKVVLIAEVRDFDAVNQLHDKVRPAGFGGPGVEDSRDVRMVHERQRLPLRVESRDDLLGVHAQLDDLERDATPHRLFLFRDIHDTASAFADLLEEFVRAYPV